MKTSINFWHLLLGDVQLGTLELKNGMVQLVQKGTVKISPHFSKDNAESNTNEKRDYAALLTELFRKR
jgi:hypothetical protein